MRHLGHFRKTSWLPEDGVPDVDRSPSHATYNHTVTPFWPIADFLVAKRLV